jgi:hypothetical protein
MMSIKERLRDFVGSISLAMTCSPDEYADWSYWTYETHMADIKRLWSEIHPKIRRDLDGAEFVDKKLHEMFEAFDAGDKQRGRVVACDIYNFDANKLR